MNEEIKEKTVNLPPFKHFIMTVGAIPTSYLESMTYYEMLVWFTNYLGKTVIPAINENGKAVTELQNLFRELQNYVNNYFDNLDVQEEINNKLDDMVEDGTISTLLFNTENKIKILVPNLVNNQEVGSMVLVILPNGYKILYDCGYTGQETAIQSFFNTNNIESLDMVIVSHFHSDHVGCFDYIAREYCSENTLFFRQMAVEWNNLPYETGGEEFEESYNETLADLGYTNNSRTPNQNEIININNGMAYIRFINTDLTFRTSYYNAYSDTNLNNYTHAGLNNFTLMCEIKCLNKTLFLSGDIELQGQINNIDYIKKCDVLQIPHHNWNHAGFYQFFNKLNPELCFFNRGTELTDKATYFTKYMRQCSGYIPTYYTYHNNVEIDMSLNNNEVLSGTTFDDSIVSNNIQSHIPYYDDYTNFFWELNTWSINKLFTMLANTSYDFTAYQTSSSYFNTVYQEIMSATGLSNNNIILNISKEKIRVTRSNYWDGREYIFYKGYNATGTNTSYYSQNRLSYNNGAKNQNLNLSVGDSISLPNQLRNPKSIHLKITSSSSGGATYDIIAEQKLGSDSIYIHNECKHAYDGTYNFIRIIHVEVALTNGNLKYTSGTLIAFNLDTKNYDEYTLTINEANAVA